MRPVRFTMDGVLGNGLVVYPCHVVSISEYNGRAVIHTVDGNRWPVTETAQEVDARLWPEEKPTDRKPPPGRAVSLDLTTWTRMGEVREYARRYRITVSEAIRALTYGGLSHYPGWPLTEHHEGEF